MSLFSKSKVLKFGKYIDPKTALLRWTVDIDARLPVGVGIVLFIIALVVIIIIT